MGYCLKKPTMKKITLSIPEEDVEEVIHLLRYAICEEPVSNDVWTLIANFCEKNSAIKFRGKEEEYLTYSLTHRQKQTK